SALIFAVAAQSNRSRVTLPLAPQLPDVRKSLEHLGLTFPHWAIPANEPLTTKVDLPVATPAIPRLPKSETLVLIARAAERHNVPAAFVQSIVAAESNFDCAAMSARGAIGLMQLMPATAADFGADPAVPAQNIDAGTRYLRWLMNRYQKKSSNSM